MSELWWLIHLYIIIYKIPNPTHTHIHTCACMLCVNLNCEMTCSFLLHTCQLKRTSQYLFKSTVQWLSQLYTTLQAEHANKPEDCELGQQGDQEVITRRMQFRMKKNKKEQRQKKKEQKALQKVEKEKAKEEKKKAREQKKQEKAMKDSQKKKRVGKKNRMNRSLRRRRSQGERNDHMRRMWWTMSRMSQEIASLRNKATSLW